MNIGKVKHLFVRKIEIFKLMHENKCKDGKAMKSKARMDSFDEIATLYKIGSKTSLEYCMIKFTKVRWLSFREDTE